MQPRIEAQATAQQPVESTQHAAAASSSAQAAAPDTNGTASQPQAAGSAGGVAGAQAAVPAQQQRAAQQHAQPAHDVYVIPEQLQKPLCGASRPHFFRGVATVVTKLFNIVEPDMAVFGRKDFQQLVVIYALVRDLDFGIEVLAGPIAREADGLACSSRNARLSAASRAAAPGMHRAMRDAAEKWHQKWRSVSAMCPGARTAEHTGSQEWVSELKDGVRKQITACGGHVDYVSIVEPQTLHAVEAVDGTPAVLAVAAYFAAESGDDVRLIDNVILHMTEHGCL